MSADPSNVEEQERLVVVADAFAAAIAAHPYIAAAPAVPVLTERKGDLNATIQQALGKLGINVAVVAADAVSLTRQGGTLLLDVRLVAQITELFLVNQGATGTKKPALSVATAVMKAVDRKPNGLDPAGALHRSGVNEFLLDDSRPFRLTADPRFVVYQVTAFTTVAL